MTKQDFKLNYFVNNSVGISLDPQHSDSMANAIAMKHLVGTLVRYSNGGQFLPYLVEKYRSESQNRRWIFTLRSDLKCANGEVIDAKGYVNGLNKVLRMYATQGPIPVISDIVGWDTFSDGGELSGLIVRSKNDVEFNFSKSAGPGFLEYLSMPYYGYFCDGNFKDNKWVDDKLIISSGPYTLNSISEDSKTLNLTLREDWSLNPKTAAKTVHFSSVLNKDSWLAVNSIVQANLAWGDQEPLNHQKILGPPDLVRSIVIDPDGPSGYFKNIENRRILRDKILEVRKNSEFRSKSATLAKSFYAGSDPHLDSGRVPINRPGSTLKLYLPNTSNEDTRYVINLVLAALSALEWKYEIYTPGDKFKTVPTDAQSRTNFDIRVSGVVAGSVVEPWVVEMMFCSNLGVTYPDPSGRVCKYARELMINGDFSFLEAGKEISKFVAEDASVVPICHGRTTWFFSNTLDVSKLAGDLIIPSFEDIALKD